MTHSSPRFLLTSLALGAAMTMAVPTVALASSSTPSVKSLLAQAKTSMLTVKGVHIAVVSTSGKTKNSVVVDLGTKDGRETITSGTQVVKIEVTPKDAYLSGDAGGLEKIMGLTKAEAKKLGSAVMVMKAGSTEYTSLQENLTTPILPAMLPATANKTLKVTNGSSAHSYNLDWSTAASSTALATTSILTFSVGAKTLPTSESIKSSSGVGMTTFTKWNENVNVSIPATASWVTYAQVFG